MEERLEQLELKMCPGFIRFHLLGGDWNMTGMCFHSVGNMNVIILIDEVIFFRGGVKPPTSHGSKSYLDR